MVLPGLAPHAGTQAGTSQLGSPRPAGDGRHASRREGSFVSSDRISFNGVRGVPLSSYLFRKRWILLQDDACSVAARAWACTFAVNASPSSL